MNYSFNRNDRISIGTEALRFLKAEGEYLHFQNDLASCDRRVFSQADLEEISTRRDYRFEQAYYSSENVKARNNQIERQLADLTSAASKAMFIRYILAQSIEGLSSEKTLKITDEDICKNIGVIHHRALEIGSRFSPNLMLGDLVRYKSPRTLRNYYSKYKNSKNRLSSLADGRYVSRLREHYFPHATEVLLQSEVKKYLSPDGPSAETIAADTKRAFRDENKRRVENEEPLLVVPSRSTILRRIKEIDLFEADCVRLGVDEARKKYTMAGTGLRILAPLERVEIDEQKVDVITFFRSLGLDKKLKKKIWQQIPRGRRWIVVAIDAATRVILGIVIAENPSSESTKRLLYQILHDKTELAHSMGCQLKWDQFGKPMAIAFDGGSQFVSDEIVRALTHLGIMDEYPPNKKPWLRGRNERFFGTDTKSLMPRLVGRTYSNFEERKEAFQEERTALTDDDLTTILINWIVDDYHVKGHGGLGGKLPINAWSEGLKAYGCPPPLGAEQIAVALGTETERTLSKKGIRSHQLHYTCEAIRDVWNPNKKQEFKVRILLQNIGFIMVWIKDCWYRADCLESHTDGVHLSDWITEYRTIAQENKHKEEVYADIRDAALKRVQGIVDDAKWRRQIEPVEFSRERLDQLERQLYHGPRFIDVELKTSNDPDLPFGQIIEKQTIDQYAPLSDVDHEADHEPWTPSNSNSWKLEDDQ